MINLIAEIGSNHAGDISLAKEMICAAAENGADYAKFQSWREEDIPPGPWDDKEKFFHFDNKRAFYKQAQLSNEEHYELISTCKKVGIKFLTTCFNFDRINFLPFRPCPPRYRAGSLPGVHGPAARPCGGRRPAG